MAKNYAMIAMKRERAGKGVARALRRDDQTPAVIYGDNKPPVTISLPSKEANLEYYKGHMFTTLCELELEGDKHMVLARDVQLHPVSDQVMHVDFLRVNDKTKISVSVPVHFINQEESKAFKNKGILNVNRHEIDLDVKAVNIPDVIEIDMTQFDIGDAIKISHVTLPDGATPTISDRDFTIATIAAPKRASESDEETAEGEEGAEGASAEGEEKPAE